MKTGSDAICVINVSTGEIRQVTKYRNPGGNLTIEGLDFTYDAYLIDDPTAEKVIFSRTTSSGVHGLFLVNVITGDEKALHSVPGVDLTEPAVMMTSEREQYVAYIQREISSNKNGISIATYDHTGLNEIEGGPFFLQDDSQTTNVDESTFRIESLAFDANTMDLCISAVGKNPDCQNSPDQPVELFKMAAGNRQGPWERFSTNCTGDFSPAVFPRRSR